MAKVITKTGINDGKYGKLMHVTRYMIHWITARIMFSESFKVPKIVIEEIILNPIKIIPINI